MRAAVYARVSTERQEREQTVASQVSALTAWVRARGTPWPPRTSSSTRGPAGRDSTARRWTGCGTPADGAFDVVAVLAPDRLARKYAYQVVLLEELRRAGCAVAFLQRPISDDPDDQLLLQIQGAVAEYERAVLYERFRRGKLQKARAGQYLGSNPPYGYRYVPKRDGAPGHLVVDPTEAELVRQLYRWLVDERLPAASWSSASTPAPGAPAPGAALVGVRRARHPRRPSTRARPTPTARRRSRPTGPSPRAGCRAGRPAGGGARRRSGSPSRSRRSSTRPRSTRPRPSWRATPRCPSATTPRTPTCCAAS